MIFACLLSRCELGGAWRATDLRSEPRDGILPYLALRYAPRSSFALYVALTVLILGLTLYVLLENWRTQDAKLRKRLRSGGAS